MLILPLNLFSSLVLRSYRGRLLRNWWRKLSPRVFRWLKKQKWRVRATCALHLRFVCLLVCFWLVGSSYVRMCMATFVFVYFYRFSCAFRTDVFQSICLKYQSHKSVVTMACLYMRSPHLLPVPKSRLLRRPVHNMKTLSQCEDVTSCRLFWLSIVYYFRLLLYPLCVIIHACSLYNSKGPAIYITVVEERILVCF